MIFSPQLRSPSSKPCRNHLVVATTSSSLYVTFSHQHEPSLTLLSLSPQGSCTLSRYIDSHHTFRFFDSLSFAIPYSCSSPRSLALSYKLVVLALLAPNVQSSGQSQKEEDRVHNAREERKKRGRQPPFAPHSDLEPRLSASGGVPVQPNTPVSDCFPQRLTGQNVL